MMQGDSRLMVDHVGKPKPIVHRAGGMLLQLAKELEICGDFTEDDVFLYYTTTGQ
jgi:acetoacetyl-CoA synthetase